jgi:hypothetical protein
VKIGLAFRFTVVTQDIDFYILSKDVQAEKRFDSAFRYLASNELTFAHSDSGSCEDALWLLCLYRFKNAFDEEGAVG